MNEQFNYQVNFTANTESIGRQINNLKRSLSEISKIQIGIDDGSLTDAINSAKQLEMHLDNAFNAKTGNLELSKFTESIRKSGGSLQQLSSSLINIGPQGQKAFGQLAQAVSQMQAPIIQTNKLVQDLAIGLKNTITWQLTSSMVSGFTGALSKAVGYAKNLNNSLNDIRIVSGQSAAQMDTFAKKANAAAKSLSTSTLDYTKAALIYYQQGLNEKEVEARTEATIKMANVTGESAENVSSYMTAIWNNFDNGSKSLEYYADVMTALGAATASSTDEIASGLEKFAGIAETVGLSYEYATSALATLISETRQSPETVGTALKTIFSRLQGLSLGETLDDGVTLNKYSEALATVGVQIQEQDGSLKSMNKILDELGGKWKTLGQDQQMALAQTVGGVRQYTQLITLMDNYDDFKINVDLGLDSEGSLEQQAYIYADSWEAAAERVSASVEKLYSSLISDELFIEAMDMISGFVDGFTNVINAAGGVKPILVLITSYLVSQMAPSISKTLDNFIIQTEKVLGIERERRVEILNTVSAEIDRVNAINGVSRSYKQQNEITQNQIEAQILLQTNTKKLSFAQQEAAQKYMSGLQDMSKKSNSLVNDIDRLTNQAEQFKRSLRREVVGFGIDPAQANQTIQLYEKITNKAYELNALDTRVNINSISVDEIHTLQLGSEAYEKTAKSIREMYGESDKAEKETRELIAELKQMPGITRSGEDALDRFAAELQEVGTFEKSMISSNDSLEQTFYSLMQASGQNADVLNRLQGEFIDLFDTSNMTTEQLTQLRQTFEQYGLTINNITNKKQSLNSILQASKDMFERLKTEIINTKVTLTSFISALGSMAGNLSSLVMGFNMIKESFIADEDVEPTQRFLNFLMGFSMITPAFMSMLKSVKEIVAFLMQNRKKEAVEKSKEIKQNNDLTLSIKANDSARKAELVTMELEEKQHHQLALAIDEEAAAYTRLLTLKRGGVGAVPMLPAPGVSGTITQGKKYHVTPKISKRQAIPVDFVDNDAKPVVSPQSNSLVPAQKPGALAPVSPTPTVPVAPSSQPKAKAQFSLKDFGVGKALGAAMGGLIAAAAVGAIIKAVQNVDTVDAQYDRAMQFYDQASNRLQAAQLGLQDASNNIDTIKNHLDMLSGDDIFEGLIKGTAAWNAKLMETNRATIELLENNEVLSKENYYKDKNGVIQLTTKGKKALEEAQQKKLDEAEEEYYDAQQMKVEAKKQRALASAKKDFAKANTGYDMGTLLTYVGGETAAGAAGGAAVGAATGAIAGGVGAAPGAGIGAIIGGIVGAIKGTYDGLKQGGEQHDAEIAANMEKVARYMAENTIATWDELKNRANKDQKIQELLNSLDPSFEKLIANNENLQTSLADAASAIVGALEGSVDIVRSRVSKELENEGYEYSDEISPVLVTDEAFEQKKEELKKDILENENGNVTIASGKGNETSINFLADYAEVLGGKNFELVDTTGTDKNRLYKYKDLDTGKIETISADEMAELIATDQAEQEFSLKDTEGKSTVNKTKADNIERIYTEAADKAAETTNEAFSDLLRNSVKTEGKADYDDFLYSLGIGNYEAGTYVNNKGEEVTYQEGVKNWGVTTDKEGHIDIVNEVQAKEDLAAMFGLDNPEQFKELGMDDKVVENIIAGLSEAFTNYDTDDYFEREKAGAKNNKERARTIKYQKDYNKLKQEEEKIEEEIAKQGGKASEKQEKALDNKRKEIKDLEKEYELGKEINNEISDTVSKIETLRDNDAIEDAYENITSGTASDSDYNEIAGGISNKLGIDITGDEVKAHWDKIKPLLEEEQMEYGELLKILYELEKPKGVGELKEQLEDVGIAVEELTDDKLKKLQGILDNFDPSTQGLETLYNSLKSASDQATAMAIICGSLESIVPKKLTTTYETLYVDRKLKQTDLTTEGLTAFNNFKKTLTAEENSEAFKQVGMTAEGNVKAAWSAEPKKPGYSQFYVNDILPTEANRSKYITRQAAVNVLKNTYGDNYEDYYVLEAYDSQSKQTPNYILDEKGAWELFTKSDSFDISYIADRNVSDDFYDTDTLKEIIDDIGYGLEEKNNSKSPEKYLKRYRDELESEKEKITELNDAYKLLELSQNDYYNSGTNKATIYAAKLSNLENELKTLKNIKDQYTGKELIANEALGQVKTIATELGWQNDLKYGITGKILNTEEFQTRLDAAKNAVTTSEAQEELDTKYKSLFEAIEIYNGLKEEQFKNEQDIINKEIEINTLKLEHINDKYKDISNEFQQSFKGNEIALLEGVEGKALERMELQADAVNLKLVEYMQNRAKIAELEELDLTIEANAAALREAKLKDQSLLKDLLEQQKVVYEEIAIYLEEHNTELDKSYETLDRITSLLDTYSSIMEVIGKTTVEHQKTQLAIADAQVKNSQFQLKGAKEIRDAAQDTYDIWKKQYDEAIKKDLPAQEIQKIKEQMDAAEDRLIEATDNFQNAWTNSLDTILARYELAVEQTIARFEDSLSPGKTLDEKSEKYDKLVEISDRFLSNEEKTYELNKLNRKVNQELAKNPNNLLAQKKLQGIQETINKLRNEETEITEYQLNKLQKIYDLRLAEIALEEAQNAKTQARLVRNAQGNWNYVFTADQSQIDQAAQQVEDARHEYNKAAKEEGESLQKDIIDNQKEMSNALSEVKRENYETEEEYRAALEETAKYYLERDTYLRQQLEISLHDLGMTYSETFLGQLEGYKNVNEAHAAFVDTTNTTLDELVEHFATFEEQSSNSMELAGEEYGIFASNLTNSLPQIKSWGAQAADSISTACTTMAESLQKVIDKIKELPFAETFAMADTYEKDRDYMAEMIQAASKGDYQLAKKLEQERNKKIEEEKLEGKDGIYKTNFYQHFDTGGYTGNWNSKEGRLAILHEKELVLNKFDTQNLLSTVDILRTILSNASYQRMGLGSRLSMPQFTNLNKEVLQQQVHIDATFPGVTSAFEIETALNNIINDVAQYAEIKKF